MALDRELADQLKQVLAPDIEVMGSGNVWEPGVEQILRHFLELARNGPLSGTLGHLKRFEITPDIGSPGLTTYDFGGPGRAQIQIAPHMTWWHGSPNEGMLNELAQANRAFFNEKGIPQLGQLALPTTASGEDLVAHVLNHELGHGFDSRSRWAAVNTPPPGMPPVSGWSDRVAELGLPSDDPAVIRDMVRPWRQLKNRAFDFIDPLSKYSSAHPSEYVAESVGAALSKNPLTHLDAGQRETLDLAKRALGEGVGAAEIPTLLKSTAGLATIPVDILAQHLIKSEFHKNNAVRQFLQGATTGGLTGGVLGQGVFSLPAAGVGALVGGLGNVGLQAIKGLF